jgi:hypothetical protein
MPIKTYQRQRGGGEIYLKYFNLELLLNLPIKFNGNNVFLFSIINLNLFFIFWSLIYNTFPFIVNFPVSIP